MKEFKEYAQDAIEFAAPYAEAAEGYVCNLSNSAKRKYKKMKKKAKKKMLIVRIKNFVEIFTNVILLAAAVIACAAVIINAVKDRRGYQGGFN